jgi:hypothetical protein
MTTISKNGIRDSGFSIPDSGEPGGVSPRMDSAFPIQVGTLLTPDGALVQIPQTADARASFCLTATLAMPAPNS